MDKLHAYCFTRNMIAHNLGYSSSQGSNGRELARNCRVLATNSQVPL